MNEKNPLSTIIYGAEGYSQLSEWIIAQNFSKIFLLVDSNTHENCAAQFQSQLNGVHISEIIEMPAGEEHKHLQTCSGIWENPK